MRNGIGVNLELIHHESEGAMGVGITHSISLSSIANARTVRTLPIASSATAVAADT